MRRQPAATLAFLPFLWALASGVAHAQGGQALKPRLEGAALVEALKGGGYVILLRHTATEEVAPDDAAFDIGDCSTQRNLSERGREQARRMGQAFEKLGIRVSEVRSSPYCRCMETGQLAFGKADPSDLLSVWDGLEPSEKDRRGARVRELLASEPAPDTNAVLITHSGALLYSFGLDTRPEGISHVFQRDAAGVARYVGRLDPDEWPRLAGLDAP